MVIGYLIIAALLLALVLSAGPFLIGVMHGFFTEDKTIIGELMSIYEGGFASMDNPVLLLWQLTFPIYTVVSAGAILFVLVVWVFGAAFAIGERLGIGKDTPE